MDVKSAPNVTEPEYAPTSIEGVVRGLSGKQRGRYFVMTAAGPIRLWKRPTAESIAETLSRHKAVPMDASREMVQEALTAALKQAKSRAKDAGQIFTITLSDALNLFEAQGHRCALTGLKLRMQFDGGTRRNPYRPSIDRIDGPPGYVLGNVRITTIIANIARADFGDEVFYNMCRNAVDWVNPQREMAFD